MFRLNRTLSTKAAAKTISKRLCSVAVLLESSTKGTANRVSQGNAPMKWKWSCPCVKASTGPDSARQESAPGCAKKYDEGRGREGKMAEGARWPRAGCTAM